MIGYANLCAIPSFPSSSLTELCPRSAMLPREERKRALKEVTKISGLMSEREHYSPNEHLPEDARTRMSEPRYRAPPALKLRSGRQAPRRIGVQGGEERASE